MALQLHRSFATTRFSNLTTHLMSQHGALQYLPNTCLTYSPLNNGVKYAKCIQLQIRKAKDSCETVVGRLKGPLLKVGRDSRPFRCLVGGYGHGGAIQPHAQLGVGKLNAKKPQDIFSSRCSEASISMLLNPLSYELGRRLFLVQGIRKFQFPGASTNGSGNVAARDGKNRNSGSVLKVLHAVEKQTKSLTSCSSPNGGLQVEGLGKSVKGGVTKNNKTIIKTGGTAKEKNKVTEDGKNSEQNVGEPVKVDVKLGPSVPSMKSQAKKKQEQRNKTLEKQPMSTINPSVAAEAKISNASRRKRSNTNETSQGSPKSGQEIHQAVEQPLEVADSNVVTSQSKTGPGRSSKKKTPQKNKKPDKITGKQSNPPDASINKVTSSCAPLVTDSRLHSFVGGTRMTNLGPLYPPTGKSVVVVESLTKAKVIQNYLGDMFEVLPSYGHVRDLAGRSGSVRPDDDFSMVWEVPASAWTHLKSIKVALNGAKNLILASDPDREGEAIAWHITEMLQQQDALHEGITVARVVFHEITESSIKSALQAPRDINVNLVYAYLARRALDYLIGFNISPLLWRKLPSCQSAGRVQSAALALICEREGVIDEFEAQEYWTIEADFHHMDRKINSESLSFLSQLTHLDSQKIDRFTIRSDEEAKVIAQKVSSARFQAIHVRRDQMQKKSPTPFITSSLQQDAANKLHFTAAYTMKLAQKLYEGVKISDGESTGLITYMRTDGLHVSDEAVKDIRSLITERYGEDFGLKTTRFLKKVKNAQEAHEAIRPTSIRRLPSTLVGILDEDLLKLYTLIWCRTMASQMGAATIDMVHVDIGDAERTMILRTAASTVGFPGYLAVYKDEEAGAIDHAEDEGNARRKAFPILSSLKSGNQISFGKVEAKQHFSKPPPRYSEGSLVQKLEDLGIGRPSTYASILKVLQDRNYVTVKNRVLYPEFRGRMVSAFLSHYFSEVTDFCFTADLENELDNVSLGITKWKGLLKDYWERFSIYCNRASKVEVRQVEKMLEETFGASLFASLPHMSRTCPSCSEGTLVFKVSRFGSGYFIGCNQHPKCKYIAKMIYSEDDETIPEKPNVCFQPKLLGLHPDSSEKIFLKNGPYGFYVQLGDDRKGYAPKRAPILLKKDVESISLEDALELLRYPVTLGNHPADQQPVLLRLSKFGFSVKHRRTIAPIPKNINPQDITVEKALKFLSSKDAKQTGRPKGKPRHYEEALEAI